MTVTTPLRLEFDTERHEYRLHDSATPVAWGRLVPSVTQVLHAVRLIEEDFFTEESRLRGRYIHKAIMLEERQGLDDASLDERLVGYLRAYRTFIRDVHPGPCLLIETPLADPVLGYAGTPDQLRPINDRLAVVDHKSGGEAAWHSLQTAAYGHLIRECATIWPAEKAVPLLDRYALYLRANGQYRLVPHSDRRDFKTFQAALAVYQFKEQAR